MSKHKKRKASRGPTLSRGATSALAEPKSKKTWYELMAWPVLILTCLVTFLLLIHGADYERRQGAYTFDESVYVNLAVNLKQGDPYNTIRLWEERHRSRLLPN